MYALQFFCDAQLVQHFQFVWRYNPPNIPLLSVKKLPLLLLGSSEVNLSSNYPEDSKILKWMVAILWALDTAHLVLCTISVYWVLVLNFDNPAILTTTTWSMNVRPLLSSSSGCLSRMQVQTDFNGLIGIIVECFYARRVWIVSRNIYLTIIILMLAVIHFALGIVFTIGRCRLLNQHSAQPEQWVTSVGLGSAAAADMLIGISLCYYLSKNRTGFSRTDNLISTLMKYSLTTGFLTGIIACLVVLTFGIMPNNFVYLAFFWVLGKCKSADGKLSAYHSLFVTLIGYVNSVLAALNSRESLRERAHPPNGSFLNFSAVPSRATGTSGRKSHAMSACSNLRDHLLNGLRDIPGTREFHINVLVSSPRKFQGLFPYAHPRPRSYLQDILVLLSEQATPDSPRVFTAAIEANVYNVPTTSCAIFYVSKVDTTGQSTSPSPAASLVRSLLIYYADPVTRPVSADHLWVHLFARAQSQYLFPNSADFSGKHPLSDVKLCAWWKRVLTEVADAVDGRTNTDTKALMKLYYVLPGFSQLEAEHSLRRATSSVATSDATERLWMYGHPYSQTEIPLPCPAPTPGPHTNLGHFIPTFDDDPKSRFMDEMASEAQGIRSPPRKRARTVLHSNDADVSKDAAAEKERHGGKEERILGELGKVSADEFWERMSFRQECVAGAVTGFFVAGISCPGLLRSGSASSPLAPQPGQVSCQLNKRVLSSLMTGLEFSTVERSIKATETLEGAIRGLCEGIAPIPTPRTTTNTRDDSDRRTPEPEASRSLLAPPSTPPRRGQHIPDVSPNPFPEPVASLETYNAHIYGSVCVSNAARPTTREAGAEKAGARAERGPHVTVLAVRKKKKRAE
ncbi:histone acetylation protein-domain-containing protein [Mycena crocata]|nr:histone acetylation protein-domain-containing protein [Mycena crocata]